MTKEESGITTESLVDGNGNPESGTLKDLAAVLEYLVSGGWIISKTTLYRHHGQRRVMPQPDGSYSVASVDKYAALHLKKTATGKKVNKELDEILKKKAGQELKHLDLKYEREKFNYEKDQGLYIRREQVEIELAGRAGILLAGLKHWVQSKAADWIAAVSGDPKRVGELINMMNGDVDEHINHYASSKEYEVVIDAAENEEEEEK